MLLLLGGAFFLFLCMAVCQSVCLKANKHIRGEKNRSKIFNIIQPATFSSVLGKYFTFLPHYIRQPYIKVTLHIQINKTKYDQQDKT